jgi:hypothetical protein
MTTAARDQKLPKLDFDWDRFDRAIQYVMTKEQQINTALITGRGEPTLYLDHLEGLIQRLRVSFLTELQTNGTKLALLAGHQLGSFWYAGLTTIALSVCSMDPERSNQIMGIKEDFNFHDLIGRLRDKFTIRLLYLLTAQDIDPEHRDAKWFASTINKAKELGAHQITFRPVSTPDWGGDPEIRQWATKHGDRADYGHIFDGIGTKLWSMSWGGQIYDVGGVSVCYADCLTDKPELDQPRSYIFDGKHLRYSWQYGGALIF